MKLRKDEKVIPLLKKDTATAEWLKETLQQYNSGQLTEFVAIARVKNRNCPECKGAEECRVIHYTWFGQETTLYHLGLVERMKRIINNFIEDVEEEEV